MVARRLRALGFNIPKWPTWPKKKKDKLTGEWIPVPRPPLKPGETFIKRKSVKKPKKTNKLDPLEQAVAAAGFITSSPQQQQLERS